MNSEEVNYLIWRYLQESGFEHTTFTFQHESSAHLADTSWANEVSAGALINVLQKGLQYMENGYMKRCLIPFSLIGRHLCENGGTVQETSKSSDLHNKYEKQPLYGISEDENRGIEQKKNQTQAELNESEDLKETKGLHESFEIEQMKSTEQLGSFMSSN
ncbi:hypothetical protein PORY_002600 [Pneumocystis oryctolagi]|uniref:Uncharacterized protein n=1 Tax=Pneumocystis oryctolagi TaxID=42067 RepID=A0ACB7C8F2_9ASCO|nr:hypothetical protein PORY_002600 [Pneumocystis oryctolagi]